MAGHALPLAYALSFTANAKGQKRISGVSHPKCDSDFRPERQKFEIAESQKPEQISALSRASP